MAYINLGMHSQNVEYYILDKNGEYYILDKNGEYYILDCGFQVLLN